MNERVTITQTSCSKNIDRDACWSSRWWHVSTSIIHTRFYTHTEREAGFTCRWKGWGKDLHSHPKPPVLKERPPWTPGALAPVSLCWAHEHAVCNSHPHLCPAVPGDMHLSLRWRVPPLPKVRRNGAPCTSGQERGKPQVVKDLGWGFDLVTFQSEFLLCCLCLIEFRYHHTPRSL